MNATPFWRWAFPLGVLLAACGGRSSLKPDAGASADASPDATEAGGSPDAAPAGPACIEADHFTGCVQQCGEKTERVATAARCVNGVLRCEAPLIPAIECDAWPLPRLPCGPWVDGYDCFGSCARCDGDQGWTCEPCPADDTLPTGWGDARALPIKQTLCPSGGLVVPTFAVTEGGVVLEGTLSCVASRISQALCGYVAERDATTRVLVQPCDLHPSTVSKGIQTNDVTFTLAVRADRASVEIYDRSDFYGATTPPVPRLLGTAWVGSRNDGGSAPDRASD